MDRKPRRNYDLLVFGVLTLLATLTWVGSELLRNVNKPAVVPEVKPEYLQVVKPSLDKSIFDKLELRINPGG